MELKLKYILALVATIIVLTVLCLFLVFYFDRIESKFPDGPKLVIDQDGGADDAMAIFMALLFEKYFNGPKVVAFTTTHGNVNEPQVFNNTQRILDIAGRRDIPIYRGAQTALVQGFVSDYYFGDDGLGDNDTVEFDPIPAQPEVAAIALIELSKKFEGELTVLALGAQTNIALAIKLDPNFISRLSNLYVAAGNVYSDKHPNPEFNAQMDVEAYHIVAANGNPKKLTLIPFSQVLNSINISKKWRREVLGSIPTEIMRAQNVFEQVSQPQSTSWVLLDPAAMAVVLNYNIVTNTSYSSNGILLCGEERGVNQNNFTIFQKATSRVVNALAEEQYKQLLVDIFSAELNSRKQAHRF